MLALQRYVNELNDCNKGKTMDHVTKIQNPIDSLGVL